MPVRRSSGEKKTCFVIGPIGGDGSDVRTRSNTIFKHVIKPILSARGYVVSRADQLAEPGVITDQIVRRLVNDDLVIADLTGHNPNVFYELAIRHVTAKPFIQLIEIGEKIPFDIATTRVIQFDHHDLNDVKRAKAAIASQIQTIESEQKPITSPAVGVFESLQKQRQVYVADDWGGVQLHHVSLPVQNVARSVRFYRDVVGLREMERPAHFDFPGAWFILPSGQQLHILENAKGTFRKRRSDPDYRDAHFAIRVTDFKKARARFKRMGHELLEIEDLKKYRYVGGYVVDPDGHVIEVNAEKDEEEPVKLKAVRAKRGLTSPSGREHG